MIAAPTATEVAARLPGDDLLLADVVLDRGFTLDAPCAVVWPWLVQLGKDRGGWYLPAAVERLVPAGHRGVRRVVPALQDLAVGDTIPDWGGAGATFGVVRLEPERLLVHRTQRGRTGLTWTLALGEPAPGRTRVHSRVRIGPVRRPALARVVGGTFDGLTIAGLAAGLAERVHS